MKDEMIKHALPPTVLVKLATITGKVFRRYDIRLDDIKFGCNDFKVFRRFDILIIIGAIAAYYMVSLQVQYGVTTKIISEMISPKLHPEAMEKVYMPMTNILLDTHDITMA
jgi:hypothetical protein